MLEGAMLGEFEGRVDAQGRIVVPRACRDPLEAGMVLSRGFDGCVDIFPPQEWEAQAARLGDFSRYNQEARLARRLMFSGAHKAKMDRQGRVVMPAVLRQHAGIAEEVVISGVNTHLEVWAKERWTQQVAQSAELPRIAGNLESLEKRHE